MDILSKLILGDLKVSQVLYYVIANYQYNLEKELVEWAECECNGYPNPCDLDFYMKHGDNLKELNNMPLNKHLEKLGFEIWFEI